MQLEASPLPSPPPLPSPSPSQGPSSDPSVDPDPKDNPLAPEQGPADGRTPNPNKRSRFTPPYDPACPFPFLCAPCPRPIPLACAAALLLARGHAPTSSHIYPPPKKNPHARPPNPYPVRCSISWSEIGGYKGDWAAVDKVGTAGVTLTPTAGVFPRGRKGPFGGVTKTGTTRQC